MSNKYLYQGKELVPDLDLGWYMFPLRPYDPALGRWATVDPYDQFHSPYVGMGNDPISGFDPEGGYTKFGAWVRALFTSGVSTSDVYESGGEWGYNTQEGNTTVFNYGHYGKNSGVKYYNPNGLTNGQGDGEIGMDPNNIRDLTVVTIPEQLPFLGPKTPRSPDGLGNPPSNENWINDVTNTFKDHRYGYGIIKWSKKLWESFFDDDDELDRKEDNASDEEKAVNYQLKSHRGWSKLLLFDDVERGYDTLANKYLYRNMRDTTKLIPRDSLEQRRK